MISVDFSVDFNETSLNQCTHGVLSESSVTGVVVFYKSSEASENPVKPVLSQCNQCCGLICSSSCLGVSECDPPAARNSEKSAVGGF